MSCTYYVAMVTSIIIRLVLFQAVSETDVLMAVGACAFDVVTACDAPAVMTARTSQCTLGSVAEHGTCNYIILSNTFPSC